MTKSTDSSSHGADGDARSRDPAEDRIRAEIAGTVLRIKIAVGDQVADGDVVAVLESMKMEIPVIAEVAGTVASVTVVENGAVQTDDIIATLVTTPEPEARLR